MLYLVDTEKSAGDRTAYEPRDGFRTRRVSAEHSVISEQPQFAKPADRRFRNAAALRSRESIAQCGFLLSSHNFSQCADS